MTSRNEVTIIQIGSSSESDEEAPTKAVECKPSAPAPRPSVSSGLCQRARSHRKIVSMSSSEAESGTTPTSEGSGSSGGQSNDVIIAAVKQIVTNTAEIITASVHESVTDAADIISNSVQQAVAETAGIISRDLRRVLLLGAGLFFGYWFTVSQQHIVLAACGFDPLLTLFVMIGICIFAPCLMLLLLNEHFIG